MKIKTKTLLLILFIVILSVAMVSCDRGTPQPPPLPEDVDGTGSPVIRVNKNDMFVKIRDGMIISEDRLEESEENYVSTEYTIHTGHINYTVVYKANYAQRRQNSEIYLKIFDNHEHMNRVFVYYNRGDLFIQTMDDKKGVEGFGSTNMFDLFFEMVTMFDMSNTFIGSEMSALFDPENVGANLYPLVDQSRMNYIMVTDTAESIEMTHVDLNYGQIKQEVNNLIKDTFEKFEDKFDLLSLKYFGFRISELAYMEIATMTGDLINVKLDNEAVNSITFEASGKMAENNNDFTLDMQVQAREGSDDINMDDTENPYLQDYPEMQMGRFNYGGTLYVPFFDMTYDATLRTILSSTDNTINEVMFTMESVEDDMGGLFYKDQILYMDISGMQEQLGGAVELEKLNLPKIKFDNIDLAQEITLLFNDLLRLVQTLTEDDIYGENEELLMTVLDHIESDEENDTMYINITKELIEKMYGEDVDLVQLIADKLEVPREMVEQLIGDDALENAVLIFSYNVENGDIGLDMYDDDILIFELRLEIIDPLPGDTLEYPPSFDPDTYHYLDMPDNTIMTLEGELSMQEVSSVKFDELFGALFGDITGKNTPYTLMSYEKLNFVLDIMQIYEYEEDEYGQLEREIEQVMKFELFKGDVFQLGVYSAEDPDYLLVDFNVPIGPEGRDRDGAPYQQSPLRYRIERQKVVDAFNELLGDDNIFALENIMDLLNRLISSLRESPSMQLRFFDNSLAFNLVSDTVYELIGIDNLNALMKARIRFATTAEEYLNINMSEDNFVTPNVRPLDNETFESIYTTQWQEFVYTYFGDNLMRLKLTYLEESVEIETGKYFYQPTAHILDETISYYVTIEDRINGIKVAEYALDPDLPNNQDAALTVDRPLKIDPSIDEDLPEKIPVLYDDDTFGYVNYIIEDFDVSNINISGMPREEYWLVIGKDSVAEKRFYISVEVLGRVIIPLNEMIMGEPVPMISNLGKPVVGEVTIDPYTFAVRRADEAEWSPLPSSQTLNFESVDGADNGDSVEMTDIEWDYDLENVQFNGGVYFSHAMYNNLTIAIKINVKSKIVSYLRFVDSINTSLPTDERPYTEDIGTYTVDILQTDSYVFPVQSTQRQEMRLYFEDGTYRIIAPRDYGLNPTTYYNNYLPITLQWKHSQVAPEALRIQGTQAPLGIEDRDINTTTIDDDTFSVGSQEVELKIIMPSRALGTIGVAGNVYAITGYETLADGSLNFEEPIREMTSYHNVAFSQSDEIGEFFEFNPYNQEPLPNTVYMNVIQGGENRIQKKAYDIEWVESDVIMARQIYDESGNLVDTEYVLRNVSTYEETLLVEGLIGDGDVSIEVKMIVKNIDAVYQDITFEGMDTNVTEMSVDPYLPYEFPSYYTLMLRNGNQIRIEDVEWYIVLEQDQEWMMQLDGRSYHWIYDYLDYLDEGVGNPEDIIPDGFDTPSEEDVAYFRLLIEKGEIPVDNRYVFTNEGGSFTIKSYIEATDSVIAQEVSLTINVIPRTVTITDQMDGFTQLDIHNTETSEPVEEYNVDTYTQSSSTMLDRLMLLMRLNDEYDDTIAQINIILTDIRKANPDMTTETVYAICYDEYYDNTTSSEKTILTQRYNYYTTQNPTSTEEQNKYNALQSYIGIKNDEIEQARVGIYFDDDPETSGQKYQLNVKWTNLEEIIAIMESSSGAVLGETLEGYIGYGQVNQQTVRIPFYVARREITNLNFNRMTDYDPSVMTVDYRYAYIGDEDEATNLIYDIIDQNEFYEDAFDAIYEHDSTSDSDKLIMEEIEESITHDNPEIRYELILNELIDRRLQNIRTVFIDMHKPLGLTQTDEQGNRIFIDPGSYFYDTLSQVSLMFEDETDGYYNPRFDIGDGENLEEQKNNFNAKILATDPELYDVRMDEETQIRYAYVDVLITHLSSGSCRYPVTVRFKAVVDQINVVYGEPSTAELEPFDEHGNARFSQGFELPNSITVDYNYSGDVTFGNISNWVIASPIPGFEEGQTISTIPITGINVLNPATMNFVIDLPCEQGEFTYNVAFPRKYIGNVMYDATAQDRDFDMLDIESGIIEIDNLYDIYDPSQPLGFDTSKLPSTINPYSYGFGEIQYDIGDMVIDTNYDTTINNSFDVQWRIVDEWTGGRRIDHNGTAVNVDGELVVESELFATAKIFSYYYYESIDSTHPILLEQEIELYLKVKPMKDPIIEYDGLVDHSDNNNISFDPYDDPNSYGGNLELPKDGLSVYFNDSLSDKHTFEERDTLRYYLLMADSEYIIKSHLFDSLIERNETENAERVDYFSSLINEKIDLFAQANDLSVAEAGENMMSLGYDALMEAAQLNLDQRESQRKFLANFTMDFLSAGYDITPLSAWNELMEQNTDEEERANIISHYITNLSSLSEEETLEDLSVLILAYEEFIEEASDGEKEAVLQNYLLTLDDTTKDDIIQMLEDEDLYSAERDLIYDNIVSEEGTPDNVEIFNRLMNMISVNNSYDILLMHEENKSYTQLVALSTGISEEDVAKGLLFAELVKESSANTTLVDVLSLAVAATIDEWDSLSDLASQRMWNFYLTATIEEGIYTDIMNVIELYMSPSQSHSLNRIKHITMNTLINIYDYNEEDMEQYFDVDGDTFAYRVLTTVSQTMDGSLESWQIIRAKSSIWDSIVDDLSDESILTRILEGDPDGTGMIDTQPIRALAYERLKQSDKYLPLFEIRLSSLEATHAGIPDTQTRRSTIYKDLYDESSLEEKVILIELIMGAAKAVSDNEQEISTIPYTQAGHDILQISDNVLGLYLLLPDGQRIDITLNIFSRQIEDVLVPNIITNTDEGEVITTNESIPNVYYIDPYNSETYRLPLQAEFEFETGYNLVLDINEWIDYDESLFYTRSDEGQTQKIFYYNFGEDSYKGGVYELTSYLTYGIGEDVERQTFTITIVVLNRTLRAAYDEEHRFDNPISGRVEDIPNTLTEDMFVDYELYYRGQIEPEYCYSNFGLPVVPQIDWNKTSLNNEGVIDEDILVEGGFIKDVQGYLRYDNTMLFKTYDEIWEEVHEQYSQVAKPIAWEKFFEITYSGERIVKTIFAGEAAIQIKSLDDDIFNEMYIEAYHNMYQNASADLRSIIDNLMITLRNNNFGLIPDQSSELWFVVFYEDLEDKAYSGALSDNEAEIFTIFTQEYSDIHDSSLNQKRAEKWDELFEMTGVWQGQQRNIALDYLDSAYNNFRDSMLTSAWDSLQEAVSQREYQVMSDLMDNLRDIYGSIEQAKIRAWDFLVNDDRVTSINGENAKVKISAKKWNFIELMDMAESVIDDITFNPFTQRANAESFLANFEVLNTLLIDMLEDMLLDTENEYMEEFRTEALHLLKEKIMEKALEEVIAIDDENNNLSAEEKDEANWNDLYQKRIDEATSPIDDTRDDVDNETGGNLSSYERDEIVWDRLWEGAGEWQDLMQSILDSIDSELDERYYQAVEEYREQRIDQLTLEMDNILDDVYREKSLDAWNTVAADPLDYDETQTTISNILFRDVKRYAWGKLYEDYSDGTQRLQMQPYVNEIYGELRFAHAWNGYYLNATSDRKSLMEKILLYYGFRSTNADTGAYWEVYEYIEDNPQAIDVELDVQTEVYDIVYEEYIGDGEELVIVEYISRLHDYDTQGINSISQMFFDEIKRDSWDYLLEMRDNDPALIQLLPENELKALSWNELWQKREQTAYDDYDVIDDIFEMIRQENFDNQLAMAFENLDIIIDNPEWLDMKDDIKDDLNKDNIKTILWQRLYDSVDSELQTSMDATLGIVLREGAELGVDAEARAWDRFIEKNEIPNSVKTDMNQMYTTYVRARALEDYKDWYEQTVTHEIDAAHEFLIESYKKSKVWRQLYSNADTERRDLMESILLNVEEENQDEDYEVQILEAFAFDDLLEEISSEEKDAILTILLNTQLDYTEFGNECIQKVNELKAREWDKFYEDATGVMLSEMDRIYENYENISGSVNRKANALDDQEFRNLLSSSENSALNNRLNEGEEKLMELFFEVRTYDEIIKDESYENDLENFYNDVYEKYLVLYFDNNPDHINTDIVKAEALQMLYEKITEEASQSIDDLISNYLEDFEEDYLALTWDEYYEYNLVEDTQKAELMQTILNDAADAESDFIKALSIDKVHEELVSSAISKITAEKESIIEVIQKSQLWHQLFGEDIFALENILNSIAPVDDQEMDLKSSTWDGLFTVASHSNDYIDVMTSVRNSVKDDFPSYTNNQIDAESWQQLYASAEDPLLQFMDEVWEDVNDKADEDLHLVWQQMYSIVSEDGSIWTTMKDVYNNIYGENPDLSEQEIKVLAFDIIMEDHDAIAPRLTEFVHEYKSEAWLELMAFFSEDEIMTNLFEEMFNLQMLYNDEIQSQAICWDRMVGMAFEIKQTLSETDPRFDEEQLKMFAFNTILDLLSSTERAILENAAEDIEVQLTAEEIDSIVYDRIYQSIIPSEKDVLIQKYDEAQDLYPHADEEYLKHKALELYTEHKQSEACQDINHISHELFSKEYTELNNNEKLYVFDNIYMAEEDNIFTVHTFDYAKEHWEDGQIDSEDARMSIFWDKTIIDDGGDIGNIYIGNAYKSYNTEDKELNLEENVFVGEDYTYRNRLIAIEYLDFYGELNRYADDEIIGTERYFNELVIDPLNPHIPNKVAAYGTIEGVNADIEIDGEMYTYIGMVDVSYESRINNYIYDEGGSDGEEITATVSPGMGEGAQNLTITTYYLDRTPEAYYVSSQNYSNEQRDTDLNLYPLGYDAVSGTNIMTIDPLNDNIFNAEEEEYILPNSIVILFTDAYADGVISTLFMNNIFDNRLDVTDVEWDLLGNEISLSGLDPANITITQYSVEDESRSSTAAMNEDFWKLKLEVTERNVERILEVNAQGMGGELLANDQEGMLQANNKIDPYNVMLSFPDHVRVEFYGAGDIKLLNNITWKFADGRGLEYLQQSEVITGEIGEAAMFLTAGFTVVSETIWINFPIQARHIDITVDGTDDIRPLEGGIIYLIKDQPLQPQLDRISSLNYNFAEIGEDDDWSEVPLEFLANDVSQISTNEVGTYTVRGRLGPINDPNITFEVIVIDPKMFTEFEDETNDKVYFDRISVAINSYGVRISGKEDEEGFLPDKFIQHEINDNAGNLVSGYNEFQIINREWDIANKQVEFTCVYTFLRDYHDVEKLGGNAAGSDELTFMVTLPIDTYVYTEVDSSMSFDLDGDALYIPLGEELKISDMPKAVMNRGTEDEFEVALLWDLREINVNRAGTYNLYGYFRDYTSSYMARSKNITVVIEKLDLSDEIETEEALIQTYNGLNQEVIPVLPDVLRENGIYTQLPSTRVLVEYITEERYDMGDFGDFRTTPYRNAGTYYVRITIDDYNVTGQKLFMLTINPIEIDPDELSFDYGSGSTEIAVPIPNWPQSEAEKERLYYDQFIILANAEFGANIQNRARAEALDILYENVNEIGKDFLDNRINQVIAEEFPEYEIGSSQEQANMMIMAKAIIWTELMPIGFEDEALVPNWPQSEAEKEDLLDVARDQLNDAGEEESELLVKAQAYDNLYDVVMTEARDLMDDRLEFLIYDMYSNYDSMSDNAKTFVVIEVKALIWDEINPTGLVDSPIIENWPRTMAEKQDILNEEYLLILNQNLAGEEKDMFILRVKAMAYDELVLNVYSSAKQMLSDWLAGVIQQYFPLYDTYDSEQKELIMIEAKAIVWDELSPEDTVIERSYIYDGNAHMPDISGLPQAKIANWPETQTDKDELLSFATNENPAFTSEQAKARAFDNLMQTIYSNIYALQKMNSILDDVIMTYYPDYHDSETSYEQRQNILVSAKARAWDTRIVPGDTVMEIDYGFEFWYMDMEDNSMTIETRPRGAGTYEITLVVDPETNPNYEMKEGGEVVITISIRRAQINQDFANQMTYTGKPILPRCDGLHDANGNLPDGVSIQYNFWQDGEPVNHIRNVGEYTFSASVDGGNNYPSWTVESQTINIVPKEMTIDVGVVESGYLQETKEFNSSISLQGIVGDDLPSMFGYLVCESEVTSRHIVGEYPINFVGFKETYDSEKIYYLDSELPEDDVMSLDSTLFGNYDITIINGTYKINKADESAIIIEDEAQLHQMYALMEEGDSQIWYLAPGYYGDFEIDKNVGLTLIGSYDTSASFTDFSDIEDVNDRLMEEVKESSQNIDTVFNSITVSRGAVTLDIIRFDGNIDDTSVYIGRNAASVDVRRSLFLHEEVFGPGDSPQPQNASAITTAPMFRGLLRLDRTYIEGFTIGVYMNGGQTLEVVNSRFNRNNAGLRANRGNVHIEGTRFEYTRGYAIYLEISVFTTINCSLYSNEAGIVSLSSATYDLWLENRFADNVDDIIVM